MSVLPAYGKASWRTVVNADEIVCSSGKKGERGEL